MSETVTLRNKKTGEVVTLRRKTPESESQIVQQPKTALQQRPSVMADLIQNPPTMQHPLGAVLRTMAGAAELGEGIPASIALDLQAGKPQDILSNLVKVGTGQRPAQYGDVFRESGVPEPLAAGGGLLTDLILSPGGADMIAGGVKNLVKASKNAMKWEGSLQQARKAKESLDTIRKTIGNAKEIAIKEVKDVPATINWKGVQSQKITDAIKNPVYGVEFTEEGGVVNTVGNLDKVKTAVGELITPKVWQEAPKTELRQIKQFYGNIVGEMKKAAEKAGKPIAKALDDYDEFMEKFNIIDDHLTDKYGNAMGNKLKSSFKIMAEPALKEAWKDVSKATPELKGVVSSMKKRELLKNLLLIGGGTVAYKTGENLIKSIKP